MKQATEQNEHNVILTVTLPKTVQERVLEIAAEKQWSISQAGRYLIKLGLEQLTDDQKQTKPRTGKRSATALA